jgi:type VI protein secretion system component Hcp
LAQNYWFLTYDKHQYLREKPYFLYNYQFLKQSSQISKKYDNLKLKAVKKITIRKFLYRSTPQMLSGYSEGKQIKFWFFSHLTVPLKGILKYLRSEKPK